jgi:hypothetical protein
VSQPDGGLSPLASGVNVGTVAPDGTAVLQFDLRVNAGTASGTVIRNQAVVESVELANVLTDGDGNPATGPEPTFVVVGVAQELSIAAQVSVVGGGAAMPPQHSRQIDKKMKSKASPSAGYGMTETNGLGTTNVGRSLLAKPTSCGRPQALIVDIKIADDQGESLPPKQTGEIWIKGAMNFTGYWKSRKPRRHAHRWLGAHRRHRPFGRGRLSLYHRPRQGHGDSRR